MNIIKITCLLLFLSCSVLAQTRTSESSPSGFIANDLDIYLLIGQSNMAGRGEISPLDELPLKNVYLFNGEAWENAQVPLNKYSTARKDIKHQKLNPGYTFGRKLAENTNRKIGLVVNARGGTSIEQWQKGYEGADDFNLYEGSVERLLKAKSDGNFKGIIWHQGESNQSSSSTYMAKLEQLVLDLRADLGENAFFVAGEINKWRPESTPMNSIISSIANHINQASYIKSDGLAPINQDYNDPHFDGFSQRVLGELYADEILENIYNINAGAVSVYSQCNFNGYKINLKPGVYTQKELEKRGVRDNDIQSLKVTNGYEVLLLTDQKTGRSLLIDSTTDCLTETVVDEEVSFLIIGEKGTTSLLFASYSLDDNLPVVNSNNTPTELKLPAIFSNHMVLQQQTDVPMWGWAKPGEKISISTSWSNEKSEVITRADGIWKTKINTAKAGGPYNLAVHSANKTINLTDVLLGEVWVCSGQSNMGFYLGTNLNAKEEVARANYPTIRYLDIERQVSDTPLMDAPGSKWAAVRPDKAGEYSAVALFFAEKLQQEMNVPVGIIEVAWGGTAADNWTPREILENDSKLEIAIDRYEEWQADFKKDSIGYYAQIDAEKNGLISKKPELPTSLFINARPHRAPSALYNGLIHPLTNYGVKGVLWYQGETNRKWNEEYAYLFKNMIAGWREAWRQDLPFYFVQLAPFKGSIDEVSAIMEAQLQVYREVENTGIVVTMDVGDMNDIHPINKKPVGQRLANWALANTYGFNNVTVSGPLLKTTKVKGNKLFVDFDFAKSGLKTEGKPTGFEIVEFNANGTYKAPKEITPIIKNGHLVFNIKNFDKPFVLRYGWAEQMEFANLFNNEGLPASSFRVLIK